MKAIVSTLVALSLVAACAAPDPAHARTKRKQQAKHDRVQVDRGTRARATSDYQEFLAEKRSFGSTGWWEQMDREGRGGQSRAN